MSSSMGTYSTTKFDPASVSRQIDSMIAAIPPHQRVAIVVSADIPTRKGSAALMIRVGDHFAFVARGSKTMGGGVDGDISARVSFLVGPRQFSGAPEEITRAEVVSLFRERGNGWLQSHIKAWATLHDFDVYLDPDGWFA